jgi:putative transcriptional regulator
MPIVVRIDVELAKRKMSVGEFSERVGLTPANVAVLKNGRAKGCSFQHPGGHVPGARLPAR